jgi:hypothetical protein
MERPPVYGSYDELPNEPDARREYLIELFGSHYMWVRNHVTDTIRGRLTEQLSLRGLPSIRRRPYEQLQHFSADSKNAILDLVESSIDSVLQIVLLYFANRGDDLHLPPNHSIRYRLAIQLVDTLANIVAEDIILNDRSAKHFADYFAEWKIMFPATSMQDRGQS